MINKGAYRIDYRHFFSVFIYKTIIDIVISKDKIHYFEQSGRFCCGGGVLKFIFPYIFLFL